MSLCPIAVGSWFLSPLLSGIMSAVVFYLIRMFILHKVNCLIDCVKLLMPHICLRFSGWLL